MLDQLGISEEDWLNTPQSVRTTLMVLWQQNRLLQNQISSRPIVSVELLADHPHLVPAVGEIRWKEWGHSPEPESLDWWVDVTAREAGRRDLPVTWVAIDQNEHAVGAVGLGEFDIEERQDRSPWVLGMIVDYHQRGLGVGGQLMRCLERWARGCGYQQTWVATGGRAIDFYRKCGWQMSENIERPSGEIVSVLTKLL
jgi:GNAT superfamily N-acetyltransferase